MSDNAEAARRFVSDVWNGNREESVYELVAEDCPGAMGSGPDATLAWHRDRRSSFPDLRYDIEDLVAADDRVVLHWHATGTQQGQFGPVPATGRAVDYHGATFLTFNSDGRVCRVWSINELFQVLQQLGVTVTPPTDSSTADGEAPAS